jgi:hypothetical protein
MYTLYNTDNLHVIKINRRQAKAGKCENSNETDQDYEAQRCHAGLAVL